MSPEAHAAIELMIEETDNPLEAMLAMLLIALVDFIFRVMEVVIEFGTDTQESD